MGNEKSTLCTLNKAVKDGNLDKKVCQKLFKKYDTDKSGSIDKHEIQNIIADILKLKGQDEAMVDEMLKIGGFASYEKQIFKFFDKGDKDGKIDKEEFESHFPEYVGNFLGKILKQETSTIMTLSMALKDGLLESRECEELFQRYDKDKSGMIERGEVKCIVGDILKAKGQDTKEVDEMMKLGGYVEYEKQLFKLLDKGKKDGKIDKKEFLENFPQYVKTLVDKNIKTSEDEKKKKA
ncbi:hypothetical protein AAMO2058_001073500 [Amorphochlora amoebiformis]